MIQTMKTLMREQFTVPQPGHGLSHQSHRRDTVVQAFGSVTGMLGAIWLAAQLTGYGYAYVLYLLSSVALTFYFAQKRQGWLMIQQAVFSVINVLGVYTWVLKNLTPA